MGQSLSTRSAASSDAPAQLEQRVRHDLQTLHGVRAPLRAPSAQSEASPYEVIIVGAGQSGLGAAFGLWREGVNRLLLVDESAEGQEGPWVSYARMATLRTPKHLTGIDGGIPSLTYRAWHEAHLGEAHWQRLDKIDRRDWMAYLCWFRRVLGLPVMNGTRVERIEAHREGGFVLQVRTTEGVTQLRARKVVLATGIQGGGEWHVPSFVRAALPPERFAHSADRIDFGALQGARIGILGGGASAFDNASFALREGVAQAHVFVRRAELPSVNPIRFLEGSGIPPHFARLDDAQRYQMASHFIRHAQPPTNDTFARLRQQRGFVLHLQSPWERLEPTAHGVAVFTPQGRFEFDFLILSTGTLTDVRLRPELAAYHEDILTWGAQRQDSSIARDPLVDAHPYLGPNFEYRGVSAPAEQRLYGLFAFNYSALASLGLSAASLSGLRYAIPRLVSGVTAQLFDDERSQLLQQYFDYQEAEFNGP